MAAHRRWSVLVLIVCTLAISSIWLTHQVAQTANPYEVMYSSQPDHSEPRALADAVVSGTIFPFVTPTDGIEAVKFYLNGQLVQVEDNAPFDFLGGDEINGNPFSTLDVPDGKHMIRADVDMLDGEVTSLEVTFTVANSGVPNEDPDTAPPYRLVQSDSPDHSDPAALDGSTVRGIIYVFTAPDDDVDDVTFYLDGELITYEDNPPFDFMGGSDTLAHAWKTTEVPDGMHEITAELLLFDGSIVTSIAAFMVNNGGVVTEPTPTTTPSPAPEVPTEEPATPTPTFEPSPTATPSPVPEVPTQEPATPTPTAEPPVDMDYYLAFTPNSDRSSPAALDGSEISGGVSVYLWPEDGVSNVEFYLDGVHYRSESNPPFDFTGSNGDNASLWDTTRLANGPHVIEARLKLSSGVAEVVSASFTIKNDEIPVPEPPPVTGQTVIQTGGMLGSGYNSRWFYLQQDDGTWKPTYAGLDVEGLLMNFRAANALFDDEYRDDDDPDANTNAFIANFDAYKAHGIMAMTVSLQGGNPGYSRAYVSAFNPDGSLKSAWMDRASRVIEAADQRGMVIILTYFYQRQDQILTDEAAVRRAVVNATDWLIDKNYRNVIIEIVNEHNHVGVFEHPIIHNNSNPGGIGELIALAKSRFDGLGYRLPVSASRTDIQFYGALAEEADIALVHGNAHQDWNGLGDTYFSMNKLINATDKPVVMNEDDNGIIANSTTLERDIHALQDSLDANGSWGLMWKPYNQYFEMGWSLGDPSKPETEDGYFHAILDAFQVRVYGSD